MENNINSKGLPAAPDSHAAELAFLRQQVMLLNERLKATEKHKGVFLSNMRNEIINPFSGILNLSGSLLKAELSNPLELRRVMTLIHQEAFALDFHLKSIFLAADIESGDCCPAPVWMQMESVIAESLGALEHMFSKKKLRLGVFQCFEQAMQADAEKIKMIFLGLLYHIMIKSSEGDGISIKTYRQENLLWAEIYNSCRIGTGSGRSLFDHAQFRELCSFTENIEGIHLSVAQSLTELLNGCLEAGVYANEIVAFRFSIPVEDELDGDEDFEEQGILFH